MILLLTVVAARLLGVLYKYPFYIDGFGRILSFNFTDFSLFGGLIFAVLGGYAFVKMVKHNILKYQTSWYFQ